MKLFVGNLPHALSEEELKELFEQCGDVTSARIINDKETGRSRGFGFVEMANGEEAIEKLNGKEVGGRAIVVNEARPQEKRERRPFGAHNRRRY